MLKSVFIFQNRPKIVSFGKIKPDLAFAFEVPRGCFAFQIIDFAILGACEISVLANFRIKLKAHEQNKHASYYEHQRATRAMARGINSIQNYLALLLPPIITSS